MEWIDIWQTEPVRNEEILFMTGDESVHIGQIYSSEKLRKCKFYSFLDKCDYECDLQTPFEERVIFWFPIPKQPERLNPETIDCAWIKWEHLVPPKDVKGIFIRFDNEQIWTDAHFYGSPEYKAKTIGNAKPVSWTFMERRNPNEKSVQC